jgi:Xaa-Pro aminopeptidase
MVELTKFRDVQRLAYRCALEVADGLKPGVTEKQAAKLMREWLQANGVTGYFHVPFAWFGDRTAFTGFKTPLAFFPTDRRLEQGMPYILDVAPVVDGYAADIGYASCLGPNPLHDKLMADLAEYRELILAGVRAKKTLRHIYKDVDALLGRHGYRNRHQEYPFGVLAHRVDRMSGRGNDLVVGGFGLRSLRTLGESLLVGLRRSSRFPFWNDSKQAEHPATPGLWAVEPHIGFGEVGVKFEELLVVTESDAYWLDDDVPHVRAWQRAA